MNLVIEFQDEGGENREALNVDKRGRYYIDSKRVTLHKHFGGTLAEPHVHQCRVPLEASTARGDS